MKRGQRDEGQEGVYVRLREELFRIRRPITARFNNHASDNSGRPQPPLGNNEQIILIHAESEH